MAWHWKPAIDSPYDPLEILAVHVRFLDDVGST